MDGTFEDRIWVVVETIKVAVYLQMLLVLFMINSAHVVTQNYIVAQLVNLNQIVKPAEI